MVKLPFFSQVYSKNNSKVVMLLTLLFFFSRSGQGSQYVGMGKDIYNYYPQSAKLVFEEAEEALGIALRSLIFEGDEETLKLTENAQPAILTTSIAHFRVFRDEYGKDIKDYYSYALGHSLGEYTALVATDAMSLADAVRLVHLRGKAMSKAVTGKSTAMSALLVRKNKLEELKLCIHETQQELPENELVAIANMNSVSIL